MKNNLILIVISLVLTPAVLFSQNFDKKSIIEDLDFLYQSLENTHYDLYTYTSKKEFTNNYLEIKKSVIQDSLSLLQATSLFQQVISKANTGHAEIDFPITSYRNYAMNGGTVFPLEIAIEDGKAYIRKNYSGNDMLKEGQQIAAIADIKIEKIIETIHSHLSAETPYFKNAKLEFWSFPRLYWQIYGKKDSFKISIKRGEHTIDIETDAIDLINGFETKRNDIINPNRFFKIYTNAAYIKPGNFSGDEEEYKIFIDSVFAEINIKNNNTLIIDLRNNTGGHNEFSDYLVSFFANKPFKWNSKFTLKTSKILKEQTRLNGDTTDIYFKEILERRNGEIYEYPFENYEPQDKSKRFSGKTYILINRHSYSMAAVTAAMIQDYNFATIAGEPTGDFPTLLASQFQYNLPNTDVVVKVPKGYIVRPNMTEH
ncbi:MAG: S41 family peptidase, partial [Saprospiraceae bacterium]